MQKVTVLSNYKVSTGVYVLEFKRPFPFRPGHVISIELQGMSRRIYSIASGNTEDRIKILYDVKKEGLVTPLLKEVKPGEWITISEPFGNFYGEKGSAFWIANGTGIAPFYSMLCSGMGESKTLIHGGRSLTTFYFQDDFSKQLNHNYIRCSSVEKLDGIYPGRLTSFLKEHNHLPPNQKYYLCGSPEMVVEVRDILISKHIPFGNIIAEIYF